MKRRRITPEKDAIPYVSAITDKPGLTMKYINPLKGRGVFAETEIEKGSFVAEYRGELINFDESQKIVRTSCTNFSGMKKYGGRKPVKKIPWNREEVKAVEKHMIKFIHKCKVPGKNDCVACIAAEPFALKDRNWLAVKFYIKNRITALKRNPIE
ncbi:uncharacterized protein ACNLHF_012512 isoform 1-T1 [Anomaloglossus baeobatrachus]